MALALPPILMREEEDILRRRTNAPRRRELQAAEREPDAQDHPKGERENAFEHTGESAHPSRFVNGFVHHANVFVSLARLRAALSCAR